MAVVVRLPSVLAGATEAVVSSWLVSPGDPVSVGTPLAEIETEKAMVEYEAEDAGIVGRLVVAPGASAQIGDPILVLVSEGETDADIDAALGASAPAAAAIASGDGGPAASVPVSVPVSGGRTFASPLVRKIAGEKGVDLASVEGTGPNGRIVRRDLERFLRRSAPAPAPVAETAPAPVTALPPGGTLIPHTPMRRAIARRLTQSKRDVPHFYLAAECVVDDLLALRTQVNENSPVKISVNDFVVMAAAAAYRDVPEANVTWREDGLVAYGNVDISIAVATEGGLVTPVLRDAGSKKLSQIARSAADLADRARSRRLRQEELEGGVLSVSNLGMFGTVEFSAIINPPQSAILAVGAAREQPVARDGALAAAMVLRCTLSVDHRAVDGALAARWLAAFTDRIEHPLGLLI